MFNQWWALAMISGAGLATRNLLFKVANEKLDLAFSAFVLSLSMALVSLLYLLGQRFATHTPIMPASYDTKSLAMCGIAGAGVGFANITLAAAYGAGGVSSLVAILQNGFAIAATVAVGCLLLGEVIRPVQALGILCAFGGIVMIVRG